MVTFTSNVVICAIPFLFACLRFSNPALSADSVCPLQLDTVHLQRLPMKDGPAPCRAVEYVTGSFTCPLVPDKATLRYAYIRITRSEVPVIPDLFEYRLSNRRWPFHSRPRSHTKYRRRVEQLPGDRFRFDVLEESHSLNHDIEMAYCLEAGAYEVMLMSGERKSDGTVHVVGKGILIVAND